MKNKTALLLFSTFCIALLLSFKPKEPSIPDKTLLDIIAGYDKLPLFNYTVKMAAVDTRPYNPNDPIVYPPTTIFKSRSTDSTTHGGKVFRLRIKDDSNYAYDLSQPTGQTIVMATYDYTQSRITLGEGKSLKMNDSLHLVPGTPRNYYIMFKSNATDYKTDNGWVYGVVTPDGKKVLQKGLIASCMRCHSESKTDRTLGAK